jgi:hypothetical protein
MRWIGLVVGVLTGLWPRGGTADPALRADPDTIPPTIASARVVYDPANPEETALLEFVYSEPVDWFAAVHFTSYIDVNTGQNPIQGFWYPPNRTEIRFPSGFYGFGTCEQVKVINVQDLAGNVIVDDGVGNVFTFHLEQLLVKGRMSERMKSHDTPPHTFALEGSMEPLTWSPLCDVQLEDADGDSTWAQKVFFCVPCTSATGGPETADVEFRFSHQCSDLETLPGNRMVTLDSAAHPDGRDTLDLWWEDAAPVNHTSHDIDVIFRVQAAPMDPPFGPGDSLGLGGSELPLAWDVPPGTRLLDDGVPPDGIAGDGIYATRLTFPTGTFRNLQFRFFRRAAAETAFAPECPGDPNRSAFLDDSLYSTSVPLELDLLFDDCPSATGAGELPQGATRSLLGSIFPNPARSEATVPFAVPSRTRISLEVVDVRGRLVRRLLSEDRPAGSHRVTWDGRTERGRNAPSGVYFVRLVAGDRAESRRFVLTR